MLCKKSIFYCKNISDKELKENINTDSSLIATLTHTSGIVYNFETFSQVNT